MLSIKIRIYIVCYENNEGDLNFLSDSIKGIASCWRLTKSCINSKTTLYFLALGVKRIVVFPLTRPTMFQTPDYFLSVKMQNIKVKHRPSTKYLFFFFVKLQARPCFFSGEKIEKNKKKFLLPTDQIFFNMLAETRLFFYALYDHVHRWTYTLCNRCFSYDLIKS